MKIENIKIEELKPADYNPRKWSKEAIRDLKKSIQEFGLVDPIIVNSAKARHNIVIGGHFRLYIAKELGFKEVPVVYLNIPEIKKEKELNLRLNRNLGAWDEKLLAEFDIDLLKEVGFNKIELDRIYNIEEDAFDAEEEYGKIKKPTTKLEDLFQLGDHRLLCGDSTKEKDYERLLRGGVADMVFTDPPYNVDYKSPGGLDYASTKFGGTGGKIFNDDKSDEDCLEFYKQVLLNLHKFTKDSATIYWWFANKNNAINRNAFEQSGWHMSQIIIWLKNSMVFSRGQDYHRCYEPCMVGWKQKQKHFKNKTKELGCLKDCFNLDYETFSELPDVWYEHRDITSQYVHPTQKPVRLAERGLRRNSNRGEIILEVFAGSGSTLIACEQMERKCYAMELDPKYCDVIIKRFEKYTGKKAVKLDK
jgi:DNA modification methylase